MNDCIKIKNKTKKEKRIIKTYQILLFTIIIVLWEVLAKLKIIDTFLFSCPSEIISLLMKYLKTGEIFKHIYISLLEVVLGLVIGTISGIIIATLLWYSETLSKILDPFLVILNALPKTALAPIMIIWAGTGVTGIVVVAISILLIITVLSVYNYFKNIEEEKIKMLQSFNASKTQIFIKLVFPSNIANIINVIKINVGMAWIGVIVGEFLVSRAGIGYLIMYGGQVFKLDMVMMGVLVLSILAYLMWKAVDILEKYLLRKRVKS